MFKAGDIVQCQFHYPESSRPSIGAHGGYYNGEIGIIVRELNDNSQTVNFNGPGRKGYSVLTSELKLILRITKE